MKRSLDSHDSIALLLDIIEHAPICIFWKDRAGCYLGCNTLFATDAGFERPEQLIGKTDLDMGWKDQAELYRADDAKVMDTDESLLGFEKPQTTPEGNTIWLRTSKVPLHNDAQEVIGILGIYEDVTARKDAELSLADSEERLRLALSASSQAWFDLHIPSGHAKVSPEYPGMLGYENDEFDSSLNHWMNSLHPDDSQAVLGMFNKGLESEGPVSVEYRRRTKSGDWIWIYTVARIVERDEAGKPLRMVGIQADVTVRKQAEQRLAESEKTYRGIFNTLNEAVYILDEQGRFIDVNEGAERMYGFSRGHFIGKTPADLSAPGRNDMNDVVEKLGLTFNGKPQSIEFWALRSNGEEFPKEVHLYPGEYFARNVVIAIATDISERKNTDAALLQSEQRLKQAQSIGGVGVWDWNLKSGVMYWSDTVFDMLGYDVDEIQPSYEIFCSLLPSEDRDALDAELKSALESGRTHDIGCHLTRRDGTKGIVHLQGQTEYDAQGRPERIMGTIQDITRSKQAEEDLQRSEADFQNIFNNLQDSYYRTDADGILTMVSPSNGRMMACEVSDLMGTRVADYYVDPSQREIFLKELDDNGGVIRSFEAQMRRFDGEIIWVSSNAHYLFDDQGNKIGLEGIARDITTRRLSDEQLRSSLSLQKATLEATADGILVVSSQGEWSAYNRQFVEMWRIPEAVLESGDDQQALDFALGQLTDPQTFIDKVMDLYAHPEESSFDVLHFRDGRVFERYSREQRIDGVIVGRVWSFRDVSERYHAEEQLREEAEFRSRLLDQASEGIVLWHPGRDGQFAVFLTWNRRMQEITGYTREEINRLGWLETMYVDQGERDKARAIMQKVLGGEVNHGTDFAISTKAGEHKVLHISSSAVQRVDMQHCVLAVIQDVTQSRQHQAQLEASRKRFRVLFDSSSDGILILDMQGGFIDVNRTAYIRLGYDKEELIALGLQGLNTPENARHFSGHLARLNDKGMVVFETAHFRKDGSIMPVEVNARLVELEGKQVILCVVRDISERKQFEEQLRQSQKMEAIGTLVGGIAHDFNNMLAAIQGNVYLARMLAEGQREVEEKITNIEQLGDRAAEMVRQLLTFARKDTVSMLSFSLNSFMKEGLKLSSTLVPENIEYTTSVSSEDLHINGDATQLQQVLMNLLNNAIDAVADVSHPAIHTSLTRFRVDDAFRQRHVNIIGDHFACLSVQDNGQGIEAEHLDKVFEPFFTTKDVGKGTGLGLSMLYGAVQTHAGVVEVKSEVGRGSTFSVYLPLCDMQLESISRQDQKTSRGQGETILLVDDQEDLRNSTAQVLEVLGYTVLQAETGVEAVTLFAEHRQQIALILSDVVMPKMGGVELLQNIRRTDAHMPFILTTGYDRQHVLGEKINGLNCTVLTKPFDFNMLSSVIHGLIHT